MWFGIYSFIIIVFLWLPIMIMLIVYSKTNLNLSNYIETCGKLAAVMWNAMHNNHVRAQTVVGNKKMRYLSFGNYWRKNKEWRKKTTENTKIFKWMHSFTATAQTGPSWEMLEFNLKALLVAPERDYPDHNGKPPHSHSVHCILGLTDSPLVIVTHTKQWFLPLEIWQKQPI